jgi:hypothetical protein
MMCEHCGTANGVSADVGSSDGWRPVETDGTATNRCYRCRSCGHRQWMR